MDLALPLLQSAWERVRENDGCAGVDGVTIASFEHQAASALPELLAQSLNASYRALPLRKILIEKKHGSRQPRLLLIPCVRDRILQTALARLLNRFFEEEFLDASFAYRLHRGVDRAVARILQLRDRGFLHIVDADIRSYFDSVSHSRLLRLLQHEPSIDPIAFSILRQWIKADVWDGHSLKPLRRGIPQGSPISPVLANFFLSSLDLALEASGNHLIRYSDDFLILCPSLQAAEKALADTQSILQASGLALHPAKTRITSFAEGFRFLGVQFRQNEAMIPWKAKSDSGRLLFLAHPMPHRLLTRYRQTPPPKPASSQNQPSTKTQPAPILRPSDSTPNDMPFLYVTQQGAILRKSGDRFLVEHDARILLDQPYHRLDHILIFGNVQITSQAMAEALDHNIGISLFSHHGRFRGSLIPPPGKNVTLRLAQYAARNDSPRSLSLARATIHAKLTNSQATLLRYENRDRISDQTLDQRRTIQNAIDSLNAASTIPEVAGFEGIAAKSYYEGLMLFNSSPFMWAGRSKHPPADPLNALLSLSYTLLMQELAALIEALGLDPAIGFLHEIDGARPSLALDLMEPFRAPIADRFVLTSINRAQFQHDDFDSAQNHPATHLKPHSLRRFFEAYELWMLSHPSPSSPSTFRDLLRIEVANFASALKSNSPWQPFSFAPEPETSLPPCNG